jgi:hypothetical protein
VTGGCDEGREQHRRRDRCFGAITSNADLGGTEDEKTAGPSHWQRGIGRLRPVTGARPCRCRGAPGPWHTGRGQCAAGGVERIVSVAAAVAKSPVVSGVRRGSVARPVHFWVPSGVGRIPAGGITDRKVPVITVKVAPPQDRRFAGTGLALAELRGGEGEIAHVALGLGDGSHRVDHGTQSGGAVAHPC